MARTTLDLDPTVLAELRERAGAEGKSMGRVGSELLAAALKREPDPDPHRTEGFSLTTFAMGRPLVDLEDKDALHAVLDAER